MKYPHEFHSEESNYFQHNLEKGLDHKLCTIFNQPRNLRLSMILIIWTGI